MLQLQPRITGDCLITVQDVAQCRFDVVLQNFTLWLTDTDNNISLLVSDICLNNALISQSYIVLLFAFLNTNANLLEMCII